MGQDDSLSSFSLDDLANETGFDRRVIRSFIEQGLMRGPDSMGRYARYSQSHLERLLAIKAMRNIQGLPLHEVRRQMLSLSHQDIRALALDAINSSGKIPAAGAGSAAASGPQVEENTESALDYILSLENQEQSSPAPPPAKTPVKPQIQPPGLARQLMQAYQNLQQRPPAKQAKASPIDHLLLALIGIKGMNRVRKHAHSERWNHISITPDIELTVRGDLSEEELSKLERVADCIREILLGGLHGL
ncbi:MAG: helix-turn-helix domain-containing protein [Terriglobales bacterium]